MRIRQMQVLSLLQILALCSLNILNAIAIRAAADLVGAFTAHRAAQTTPTTFAALLYQRQPHLPCDLFVDG